MIEHGVNVVVVLREETDWDRFNELLAPWDYCGLGAGTGFGRRDAQFEAPSAEAAFAMAVGMAAVLTLAGLDVETCKSYEVEQEEEPDA
ncbi:MAG TPA: hypothetical protein VIX41_11180 [Acidimicrobiales bacterium]